MSAGKPDFTFALIAAAALLTPGLASAAGVTVRIDQNALVDLAAPAGNIVIGNPSIADVNLITPRRMVIFGRAYGLTNIIVMDRAGRTIFQQEVNVAPASNGRVSIYRGTLTSNYACSPRCERTPMPGEDKSAYEPVGPIYKDYGDRARSESAGQGGNGGGGQ